MERYNYEQDESYIKRLGEYIDKLEEENETLKKELHNTQLLLKAGMDDYMELEEENKKLREFKAKQEEMMSLIGASIYYLAKPKTAMDAEKLQKGKEIFEKIMLRRLHLLEEENKELKEENELLKECNIRNYTGRSNTDDMNLKLLKENKKLKEENERLKEVYDACNIDSINRAFKIGNLEMENKKLKESLDIATKCSSKEEDGIIRLSEENKKLKEELEFYKKQYEHSMGED